MTYTLKNVIYALNESLELNLEESEIRLIEEQTPIKDYINKSQMKRFTSLFKQAFETDISPAIKTEATFGSLAKSIDSILPEQYKKIFFR
jgi:hypothetical protein